MIEEKHVQARTTGFIFTKTVPAETVYYSLWLPKHKEACLHWINGGEVQGYFNGEWVDIQEHNGRIIWDSPALVFMNEEFPLRIKKEKLYISVKTDKYEYLGGGRKVRVCSHAFVSKEDEESYLDLSESKLIEIEV